MHKKGKDEIKMKKSKTEYFLLAPQGIVLCTPLGRLLIYRTEIFAASQGNLCKCYTTLIVKVSFLPPSQPEFQVV